MKKSTIRSYLNQSHSAETSKYILVDEDNPLYSLSFSKKLPGINGATAIKIKTR